VFLGGLQSAQALIVTWATWLRATFPKELEVGDEEQAMLDYAAALAAEGETPA
jgi:transketolase C-terminal domain/subunit